MAVGDVISLGSKQRVSQAADSKRRSMQKPNDLSYYVDNFSITTTFNNEQISAFTPLRPKIEAELSALHEVLDSANPNVQIIALYRAKRKDHESKVSDLRAVESLLADHKAKHEGLKLTRHRQFREGFELIARHVKAIYRLITSGGDADLETIDQLDPFSEGVLF